MALSAKRRFSKGSTGLGSATSAIFDKFEQSANPRYHVGYKVETADGSVYRYVHFGATVNRGVLVAGDISETSVVDSDNLIIAPASAVSVPETAVKPGAIGSFYVEITLASVAANQFAGGKFVTTDDTGEGYTYDIVSNTATDNPASGNFRIKLQQPLQVALDATTDFSIQANRYHNMEILTTTDEDPAGVTCATISAADNYGWIQTKGVVGILQDGTMTSGAPIQSSDGTSGAVQPLGGGGTDVADLITEPIIGYCLDPGDTGGHGVFQIFCE